MSNLGKSASDKPSTGKLPTRDRLFELVKKIKPGFVTSYKVLGLTLGVHPRVVGRLLHTNTNASEVPCHRVVHADGSLAGGYAFGGLTVQRQLLEAEGVEFEKDRVKPQCFLMNFTS
jgi:methylated-DNA-protein-cysteine methyltransferase related protein